MMAESCVISIKTEPQPEIDWSNELDHVPFLLRRQMLLSSKLINSCSTTNNNNTSSTTLTNGDIKNEFDSQGFPNGKETHEQSMQLQNDETKSSSAVHLVAPHNEVQAGCGIADKCSEKDSACQVTALPDDCIVPEIESHSSQKDSASCTINGNVQIPKLDSEISRDWKDFADDLDHIVLKERQRMLLLSKLLRSEKPVRQETPVELNPIKTTTNIPARRNSMRSSTMLNLAKVKAEPLYSSELHKPGMSAAANLSLNIKSVKSEVNVSAELNRDEVDDMQLQQRMKLQIPEKDSKSNTSDNFQCSGKGFPSVEEGPTVMQATNPIRTSWPRKRKKTATDSIETALEEDAPGLLQVLIEQGVSIDEMKLYGETENDEPIDESFIEDGFADLEAVISKIFFHQSSFLKFGILKCTKGTKPSYCLACLFSLVEQTRYLRFRNWPAEWGWCRDLQSFIFVFERHKRIVMERPEYGYATYFFELVDSLTIDWQVRRLVTCMKLTNCGRINLIENKTLTVGEDLAEGEAKVLMQYGWVPNSGLGTMLNYRDRVFHDRKNEKDTSEWKSKIGKLLMDGYKGGSLVSSSIQEKSSEIMDDETPEIKTEL